MYAILGDWQALVHVLPAIKKYPPMQEEQLVTTPEQVKHGDVQV